jgi:hypothetical protein
MEIKIPDEEIKARFIQIMGEVGYGRYWRQETATVIRDLLAIPDFKMGPHIWFQQYEPYNRMDDWNCKEQAGVLHVVESFLEERPKPKPKPKPKLKRN